MMPHINTISVRVYAKLARLAGRGWFHYDRYWEERSVTQKSQHLKQSQCAIEMFYSQAIAANLTVAKSCATDPQLNDPSAVMRVQAIRASLLVCADVLNKNRPGILKRIFPCLLLGTLMVFGCAWISSILILLYSDSGLRVSYFKGIGFEQKIMEWAERRVVKNYGEARPCLLCPRKNFSARWEGFLFAPRDDEYEFYAQSIGGVRVFIDDTLVIDDWDEHGWIPGKHGKMALNSGKHKFCLEYYHTKGNAALRLRWTGGGIPGNTILGGKYLTKR